MSDRWLYKVHEVKVGMMGGLKTADIEEQLQKLGALGWELVNAVHATPVGPTLLFLKKRA